MAGHKPFSELRDKMSPDSRQRSDELAKTMLGEMLLAEMRRHANLTQVELAEKLGIKQPSLSQLESQDDMQISTLQRIVQALGGSLEIIAHLPEGDVRLHQFQPHE